MRLTSSLVPTAVLLSALCGLVSISCSDSSGPTPGGAYYVVFGNDAVSGITCPANGKDAKIGIVDESEFEAEFDGENGVTANCKLLGDGSNFELTAEIRRSTEALYLSNIPLRAGETTQGRGVSITSAATASRVYSPPADSVCEFDVIKVKSSAVWMRMKCPRIENPNSPGDKCSLVHSYVFFDNCSN